MTKNLSNELLTLKAVLLMRLIDKKESKVMAVKTIDISLEEDDERSVALDRIKKVTITEGNEEIQLAIQ